VLPKLVVVADGDPNDRRTWSGTPFALVQALREMGHEVDTFSPRLEDLTEKVLAVMALLDGRGRKEFRRSFGVSHSRAVRRWREYRLAHPGVVAIHTSHYWLNEESVTTADFLFRDTPWSEWALGRGLSPDLVDSYALEYGALVDGAGGVFTTSEWASRGLAAMGSGETPFHVVHTGLGNQVHFEGPKTFGSRRVLAIAKVRPYDKGLDLLIDAFWELNRAGSDITLDLVGPVKWKVDLPPNVTKYGWVSLEELERLYREADIFALPARLEPYGLVYLEAMRLGLPVLGSNWGAFPEFAGESSQRGFVLPKLSSQALSEALLDLVPDKERLQAMSTNAVQFASSMSWQRTARLISGVVS